MGLGQNLTSTYISLYGPF